MLIVCHHMFDPQCISMAIGNYRACRASVLIQQSEICECVKIDKLMPQTAGYTITSSSFII